MFCILNQMRLKKAVLEQYSWRSLLINLASLCCRWVVFLKYPNDVKEMNYWPGQNIDHLFNTCDPYFLAMLVAVLRIFCHTFNRKPDLSFSRKYKLNVKQINLSVHYFDISLLKLWQIFIDYFNTIKRNGNFDCND